MTMFGREQRADIYRRLAEAADVRLSPRATWLLYRIADNVPITEAALARLLGVAVTDLEQRLTELTTAGYVAAAGPGTSPADGDGARASRALGDGAQASPADGDGARASRALGDGAHASPAVALTPAGQQAAGRLTVAREAGIDRLCTEWEPDKIPELRRLLGRITTTLVATDVSPERDGAAAQATLA